MSVRACQVTMAMEHPDCSQRVLMLKRMKGLNQQKRKCWTSKGAGTMAWSRVKRRVLLWEDPESPWMSGRGVGSRPKSTEPRWTGPNRHQRRLRRITMMPDRQSCWPNRIFFFFLLWPPGTLLILTQMDGNVALKLQSHFKINVILYLQQNKYFFWSKRFCEPDQDWKRENLPGSEPSASAGSTNSFQAAVTPARMDRGGTNHTWHRHFLSWR